MTKIRWTLCLAAVLALVGGVAAQNPAEQPKPAEIPKADTAAPAEPQKKADVSTVTLVGCLQAGTETGTFTLTNATMKAAGASATTTPAEPPASPTAAAKDDKKSYTLTPGSSVDLKAHVGHRVEVTGSWSGTQLSEARPGELPRTEPGAMKKVEVTTIKHLSPTCP